MIRAGSAHSGMGTARNILPRQERKIVSSDEINVTECNVSGTVCCICELPVPLGTYIYKVDERWAMLTCVAEKIRWYVAARDRKRAEAGRG